jgi:hypothetical protein
MQKHEVDLDMIELWNPHHKYLIAVCHIDAVDLPGETFYKLQAGETVTFELVESSLDENR